MCVLLTTLLCEYINLFADEVVSKDICVGTFAYPDNPVYSEEVLGRAEILAAKAKEAVFYDGGTAKYHVEIFALGIEYTRLFNKRGDDPDDRAVDCFIRKCVSLGTTHIREGSVLNLLENQRERMALLGK